MSAKPVSIKTILYKLFANLTIALAKAVAAFLSGSGTMAPVRIHTTGSEEELLNKVNRVEHGFRPAFPMTKWLFFEPDNRDN